MFPLFFFSFLVSQKLLLSAGRMTLFQKNKRKKTNTFHLLSQTPVQLCCTTYLDWFLTQPWPTLRLDPFHIVGPFSFLNICRNPYFIGGFSKNSIFVAHPQKIRNIICEHNCANWFFGPVVLHFCLFLCLPCPVLVFFERNEKAKENN